MINLDDPKLEERLSRRSAQGKYEISEVELVLSIRTMHAEGNVAGVQRLSEVLLRRSMPSFQFHSLGLRHRPDLREDAIANMGEHLLREALDPKEKFMTQNFIHYLRCLCADEFNRVLRHEGLGYKRDEEGRPAGRPQHVPRALVDSLQPPTEDENSPVSDVADPSDQYETMHAMDESQRILRYLSDPLDRTIMVLRVLEEMKWDDIAKVCDRTERTVRLRFERSKAYLSQCLIKEQQMAYSTTM